MKAWDIFEPKKSHWKIYNRIIRSEMKYKINLILFIFEFNDGGITVWFFNEDEKNTDSKFNQKNKIFFYYLILLLLLINDDNYGSLCEEFLTSFLLRYHVITHPCSDIIFNNLKKNIFF